jgi:hypothetical protein
MGNMLLQPIEYQTVDSGWGVARRYLYPNGQLFEEFTSHARWLGIPLLHRTQGKCPETGKLITARGVIAIGRRAIGIVALGQMAIGVVAVGQLAIGVVIGVGQAATGVFSLGQLALGAIVGLGQFATGYVAVGQLGFGRYVMAQLGWGEFVVDSRSVDPQGLQFFRSLWPW